MILLSIPTIPSFIKALVFLCIASSDFLDGYIARKFGQESDLGKLLDPLADKALIITIFLYYIALDKIVYYWVALIVFREFSVLGLRLGASLKNIIIKADIWGKLKTVWQIVTICILILDLPYQNIAIWIMVVITILSGINYFIKNKEVIYV